MTKKSPWTMCIHTGSMLIMWFQGEMGSEGSRGLSGETGLDGAKVRFRFLLSNFNLSPGMIIFPCSPPVHRGRTAFQDPEDHPGHQEILEKMWVKIHIKKNLKDTLSRVAYIKNCYRAPEVIKVKLDQEENLDHLDQRCVYLCTRIFLCFCFSSSVLDCFHPPSAV